MSQYTCDINGSNPLQSARAPTKDALHSHQVSSFYAAGQFGRLLWCKQEPDNTKTLCIKKQITIYSGISNTEKKTKGENTMPRVKQETNDKQGRLMALDAAVSKIEKDFGKGSIMKLGEMTDANVEAVSTGSIGLDIALGVGGIPKGRIVEIFGPESGGKTTLALHMIAEIQKNGGVAGFIDAEHALDPVYASAIGVDINELYVSQPDSGEQALEITETMIRSGAVDLIVIDSVAALVPKAEIDGEMGDAHVGLQARMMSQACRKLTAAISKTNCVVVFINQIREKVGIMFGNPEVTTGGRALKFYSSVRLDIRRIESLKSKGEVIGNRVRVKVVKNKVAPPFRQAEFDIIFGKGVSQNAELVDIGVERDIIQKSGSWFSYKGEKIGQGREKAIEFLANNPEIKEEIKRQILPGNMQETPEILEEETE